LGFFEEIAPNNNNNNKMSSDMGLLSDPRIITVISASSGTSSTILAYM